MARLGKHLYLRAGKYWLRVQVRGREIRKVLHEDLAEAKRLRDLELPKLRNAPAEPPAPEPEPVTVKTLADRWLEDLKQHRNEKGQRLADQRLKDHILPILGPLAVQDVTLKDLKALRRSVEAKRHPKDPSRKLTVQTVHHIMADTRALLGFGVEEDEIPVSPFKRRLLPRLEEPPPRALDPETLARVLEAAKHFPKYEGAVRLALLCGLRYGNVRDLQWRHAKDLPSPHLELDKTKSGRVVRVPLCPEAVEILKRERERSTSVYVFSFRAKNACSFVDRIGKLAGVKWNFHALRHCYGTAWVEAGGNLALLSKAMGHGGQRVTERYAKAQDTAVFAEAKRIGRG